MEHIYDEATDQCVLCRAELNDGGAGIGCEAEDAANPDWYLGLALTAVERALGYDTMAKWQAVCGHREVMSGAAYGAALQAWNDRVIAEAQLCRRDDAFRLRHAMVRHAACEPRLYVAVSGEPAGVYVICETHGLHTLGWLAHKNDLDQLKAEHALLGEQVREALG